MGEYPFAGDVKRQRSQQAWGSRCADFTAPPRSVPSLVNSIAQNKVQTPSPKGGRKKCYKNNMLLANVAEQQN